MSSLRPPRCKCQGFYTPIDCPVHAKPGMATTAVIDLPPMTPMTPEEEAEAMKIGTPESPTYGADLAYAGFSEDEIKEELRNVRRPPEQPWPAKPVMNPFPPSSTELTQWGLWLEAPSIHSLSELERYQIFTDAMPRLMRFYEHTAIQHEALTDRVQELTANNKSLQDRVGGLQIALNEATPAQHLRQRTELKKENDDLKQQLLALSDKLHKAQKIINNLNSELASPAKSPLYKTRTCPACGKQTRVTTAGCDHCDFEDK